MPTFPLIPCVQYILLSLLQGVIERRASASESANIGYATLNGGTTGGIGGPSVTVSSLSALQSAVKSDDKKIVYVQGTISGTGKVEIGSNTSLLGKNGAGKRANTIVNCNHINFVVALQGIALSVKRKNNVIIRGLKISKVVASTGDAIGIQYAKNVWVDHVDLSSDMDHHKVRPARQP